MTLQMCLLASFMVGVLAYQLVRLDCPQRLSPDGEFYLRAAKGEPTPCPYHLRWLLPFACGVRPGVWRAVSCTSVVLLAPATFCYAVAVGLSAPRALVASALICGLPGIFRLNVTLPVLVDAPALTLSVISACLTLQGHPIWGAAIALLAGACKETAPVFAALFSLSGWPLLGLLGVGWWRVRAAAPPGIPWLVTPFKAALAMHRGQWLDWKLMLLPWGAVPVLMAFVPWPDATLALSVGASLLAGYGQMLFAQDMSRLYGWAAPPLVALAATSDMPMSAMAVGCFINLFNPHRGV